MSCKICGGIKNIKTTKIFDDTEIDASIINIFNGLINTYNLDVNIYLKTAKELFKGVEKGFKKDLITAQFGTPDYDMLKALQENVYIFSAAKQYQSTKLISELLVKNNQLVSFSDFKKDATNIFKTFNEKYLTVEYNSATMQARAASQWIQITNDSAVYRVLEYHTVGDGRVRNEHKILDGLKFEINDPKLKWIYPPLDYNCRCTMLQLLDEKPTAKKESDLKTASIYDSVPPEFRFNAGIEKKIFINKHSYFNIPKEDKNLALNNFNLPIP